VRWGCVQGGERVKKVIQIMIPYTIATIVYTLFVTFAYFDFHLSTRFFIVSIIGACPWLISTTATYKILRREVEG